MPRDQDTVPLEPSVQSRPLRTGKSFVLVVPAQRIVMRRWDKARYEPGEECRMTIHGAGLGKDPLPVVVESQNEDGTWSAVAKLQAEVAEAGDHAVVSWKLPEDPVVPGKSSVREAEGSVLTGARFEDPDDLEPGEQVWMRAQAPGLEGQSVQVVLEQEAEGGGWERVAEAVTTVRSGAVRTSVLLERDDGKDD